MLVRSRLASAEEPKAARTLRNIFADEGIRVVEGAGVLSVRTDSKTGQALATAETRGGTAEFSAARLLMATGRRAATQGLNLEGVAVRTGIRGEIPGGQDAGHVQPPDLGRRRRNRPSAVCLRRLRRKRKPQPPESRVTAGSSPRRRQAFLLCGVTPGHRAGPTPGSTPWKGKLMKGPVDAAVPGSGASALDSVGTGRKHDDQPT